MSESRRGGERRLLVLASLRGLSVQALAERPRREELEQQ
jgi:hypothetical protein